jgi:GT2 family glycosyltransferase
MRRLFLDSKLSSFPFQLLPNAIHPPERLEKLLDAQYAESEYLHKLRFKIFSFKQDLPSSWQELRLESFAVQSYQEFNLEQTSPNLTTDNCDYLIFIGENTLLHPAALFILNKQLGIDLPDLCFANSINITFNSKDEISKLSYERRAPLSKYRALTTPPCGELLVIKRSIAVEVLKKIEISISEIEFNWSVALEAIIEKLTTKLIPLALSVTLYERDSQDKIVLSETLKSAILGYSKRLEIAVLDLSENLSLQNLPARKLALAPKLAPNSRSIRAIIPFKNNSKLTITCVTTLLEQKYEGELEIVLIDNGSDQDQADAVRDCFKDRSNIFIIRQVMPFNFARLNNLGAKGASTEYLFFLNNDVELRDRNLLSGLASWAAQSDVAAVGALLFYGDKSGEKGDSSHPQLQHGGISYYGFRPGNVTRDGDYAFVTREVQALSLACAVVKRHLFEEVGGLDENLCPNGFGDVLFSERLRQKGYSLILNAEVSAIHYESITRKAIPEELELLELYQAGVMISHLDDDFSSALRSSEFELNSSRSRLRVIFERLRKLF